MYPDARALPSKALAHQLHTMRAQPVHAIFWATGEERKWMEKPSLGGEHRH